MSGDSIATRRQDASRNLPIVVDTERRTHACVADASLELREFELTMTKLSW